MFNRTQDIIDVYLIPLPILYKNLWTFIHKTTTLDVKVFCNVKTTQNVKTQETEKKQVIIIQCLTNRHQWSCLSTTHCPQRILSVCFFLSYFMVKLFMTFSRCLSRTLLPFLLSVFTILKLTYNVLNAFRLFFYLFFNEIFFPIGLFDSVFNIYCV